VSRHTEHYAALSQRYATTDTILTGMLEAEAGNLRAATVRARELGDGHLILRLAAGALTAVFQGAGSLAAAREFVALGLEAESEEGQLRARGLTLLSFIAYREGDYETAMDAAHQAVELAREIGNDLELANAIVGIGAVAAARGDHLEGVRRMEEARTVYRRIGNRSGEGVALANLGDFAASAGEHERAAELFREALDVFADVHDAFGEAHARINLAAASVHLVRLDEAAEHARWCLRRYQRLGDDLGVGTGFQVMAGSPWLAPTTMPQLVCSVRPMPPAMRSVPCWSPRNEPNTIASIASSRRCSGPKSSIADTRAVVRRAPKRRSPLLLAAQP
jgi:tetratricopeptide (TPR) repeat protein